MYIITYANGAFTNYVDQIFPIIDHLSALLRHKCLIFFQITFIRLTLVDISSTTYLP